MPEPRGPLELGVEEDDFFESNSLSESNKTFNQSFANNGLYGIMKNDKVFKKKIGGKLQSTWNLEEINFADAGASKKKTGGVSSKAGQKFQSTGNLEEKNPADAQANKKKIKGGDSKGGRVTPFTLKYRRGADELK